MHCASFHFFHQGGLWQRYQPRGPMHPIKISFRVHDFLKKSYPESSLSFLRHIFRLFRWWVRFVTDVMIDDGMSSIGSQFMLRKTYTDNFKRCWMTNEKSYPESSLSFLRHIFRLFHGKVSWWGSFVSNIVTKEVMGCCCGQHTLKSRLLIIWNSIR